MNGIIITVDFASENQIMEAVDPLSEKFVVLLMTNEDYYEIINGVRVEVPPMGAYQSVLASNLCFLIGLFARTNNLGRVVTEVLFQLDADGKQQRRPDLAFVSYKRWSKTLRLPHTDPWDVIPNLAIEVISPSGTLEEIPKKIHDYFFYGVQCVWVIFPASEQVYVYSSPTKLVLLTKNDHLNGSSILPGFQVHVAKKFEDGSDDAASSIVAPPS